MAVNSEYILSSDLTHEVNQWISESVFYKALVKSFSPVRYQDDWLEAKMVYKNIISPG